MSSIPAWLVDLLKDSSPYGLALLALILVYKIFDRLIDSPLTIATIVAVLAGAERRKDASEIVGKLCSRDDDPAAIEGRPAPGRWWRRRGRRRRRRRRRS